MIVGIIGSGGREHAICTKIKESSKTSKIFCIPGNAGTNHIAENIDIKIEDFKSHWVCEPGKSAGWRPGGGRLAGWPAGQIAFHLGPDSVSPCPR